MAKRGKKNREKNKIVCPSFEFPVCPACGYANKLVEESGTDDPDPIWECTRCWVRFMMEDSRVEVEEEETPAMSYPPLKCALCMGRGCEVCDKKKPTKEVQTEPLFGECEELTDGVAYGR